ncbi:MAG: DUF5808 domain-containing protein [Eubacterium sp.]|nr:DUF5808 domain-containing protein [Eubacterium sp.]
MNLIMGFTMIICIDPILLYMLIFLYPKNWQKKKLLFGVTNRAEFKLSENEPKVEDIVFRNRDIAYKIIIPLLILSFLLLLIPSQNIMMFSYIIFILVALSVSYLPYINGNRELKNLKREIGIAEKDGIKAADIKTLQESHALNLKAMLIPIIVNVLIIVFSIIYDLGFIHIGKGPYEGSFFATINAFAFGVMNIFFLPIAIIMDNMRNEIISNNSDVNVNFNRAKKKIWADAWLQISWLTTIILALITISVFFDFAEMAMLIGVIIYMVLIMTIMFLLFRKTALLSGVYSVEGGMTDDDDCWIYGLFYYNPRDARLNIEKRDGLGSTINMAHPLGKIISAIVIISFIACIGVLIWGGIISTKDPDVFMEDNTIICNHLSNVYEIKLEDIEEVSYNERLSDHNVIRIAGLGMENMARGDFSVDGVKCKLFYIPTGDDYLIIKTSDRLYYINDKTDQDTKALYDQIVEGL